MNKLWERNAEHNFYSYIYQVGTNRIVFYLKVSIGASITLFVWYTNQICAQLQVHRVFVLPSGPLKLIFMLHKHVVYASKLQRKLKRLSLLMHMLVVWFVKESRVVN